MRVPFFGRQQPRADERPAFAWLSPAEAKAKLDSDHVQLIDVREEWEYTSGHIPGARSLPLRALLRQGRQELTSDNIIFVCAVGERATAACEMAASLGFAQVYNIRGGTNGWIASGYPGAR